MQAVAKQEAIDYWGCVKRLRKAYKASEVGGDNVIADYIQAKPKDYDSRIYRTRPGRESTHATATRPSGKSVVPMNESDWFNSRLVSVAHSLPDPYPAMLRALCHENPSVAEIFSITNPLMALFRGADSIHTASNMANFILRPWNTARAGEKPKIWALYGYTSEEWMDAKERKTWDCVRRRMRQITEPAVVAWAEACREKQLEF